MTASQKQALRTLMKKEREHLFLLHPEAGEKITGHFFDCFDFSPPTTIGAYWPVGSEVDTRFLLNTLSLKGFTCALPCIAQRGLLFRAWDPSLMLVTGKFNLMQPPLTSPIVTPDVLLVPLLAFDKTGHRLGYGQGHYDHYLHHHKVITIGLGFRGQEVEKIPRQAHDVPLTFILTEEGLVKP